MNKSLPFLAAPLLILAYGLIRAVDGMNGERGPGLAWTTGHLAFLAALVLFVPLLLELRRRAGSGTFATVTVALALAGVLGSAAQMVIDLVIGALASDHEDMRGMFSDIHKAPGVDLFVYELGPVLFFVGLCVVFCALALARAVPVWQALAVSVAVLLAPASPDLLPAVGLLLFVGLAPSGRRAAPATTAHP